MAPEDALKSLSPLHRGVLACLWADAAVALAESNRATVSTEALLQAYIGDAAPQWIAGELAARGKGRDCLFRRDDGSVYVTESARWIDLIREGQPMAEGMEIEGKFRRPVKLGKEKPARTFPVDPFALTRRPLTMPGFMSACGASLAAGDTPVGDDKLLFLCLIARHERPSPREQQAACAAFVTGDLDKLMGNYPLAKKAFDDGERPEVRISADAAAPVATPILRSEDVATPRTVDLAISVPEWACQQQQFPFSDRRAQHFLALCVSLYPAREDIMALCKETLPPAAMGRIGWSNSSDLIWRAVADVADRYLAIEPLFLAIAQRNGLAIAKHVADLVHDVVVTTRVHRDGLMAGIDRRVLASMPTYPTLGEQVIRDVWNLLQMGTTANGDNPWLQYLKNGLTLTEGRRESATFRYAIEMTPFMALPGMG
jgi:hypothetical protein